MALVIAIVNAFMALLAPAVEIVAPLGILIAELLFWLLLLLIEVVIAIVKFRKPKWPSKPKFTKSREYIKSLSSNLRNKQAERKSKSKTS